MSEDDQTQLRFDWQEHAERQGGQGTFLSWLFTEVLAGQCVDDEARFEELSQATDRFRDVHLSLVINGITVNADAFVRDLECILDSSVEREARRLFEEKISEFPDIHDAIESARRHLIEKLAAAGVLIPED